MITTLKNQLTRKFEIDRLIFFCLYDTFYIDIIGAESLPTLNSRHTASSVKKSGSPDILSAAVLHKRRPEKRVRFALKFESVGEDSLSSSREDSPSLISKSNKRIIDPWRHNGPLYGAYVEYLDKQDALTCNDVSCIRRTPPPPPPPPPEPGASPITYTHTFVIQSKSPEIVIDSITVSTPPLHLPRILHRTQKTNKQKLPILDSYAKQQLTSSTHPRMIHTNKVTNSSNQKPHYASVRAALKRAELNISPTNGLHSNNKITRSENSFGSKFFTEHIQTRKMTEIITKPLPGVNNQINHFSERTILPNYSQKSRVHNRTSRPNDELKTPTPYFCQNHDHDRLLQQPVIHSTH